MRWVTLVSLAALVGCGSADTKPGPEPETCDPPNRIVGEACLEPGVQDNGCPAGTLGWEDGSCRPAGVPPEMCLEGWVHDGDAACDPILPVEPCPSGLMAVPGEATCHPVMECGSGAWGNIPVDASTVYVDAAYAGGISNGSDTQPFTAIADAIAAAPDGALIAVAAGTYDEVVVFNKPLRLWGVCPEQGRGHGQEGSAFGAASLTAVYLGGAASGSELHGVAVTGDKPTACSWTAPRACS